MTGALASKRTLVLRSVAIAGLLTVLKLGAALVSQSMAILASAADSLMDLVISLANLVSIQKAEKPADLGHPYGHGKIESLAGLFQSLFIGAVAIGLVVGAVLRFIDQKPLARADAGVAVMVAAMALNWWHARNLRRSMNTTESPVMASEYVHYAADFLGHLGVIVSLVLYKFTGQAFWDPLTSIFIALYLGWSVTGIFRTSVSELLDSRLPEPIPSDIAKIIRAYSPKILDFHELRTRKVGTTKFVEFHIELRGVENFKDAHDLTEGLIARLREAYPGAVITVHTDPEGGV